MTTEIGIDGSVRCRDETGLIWSWINGDGGLTIKDVKIKYDNCLDCVSLYPQYFLTSEHEIICDEFISFKKGNENMKNEIIKLYADRKAKSINEKYDILIESEYNELEEVKRYNELINNFDASLAELVDEFNRETYKPFVRTGYTITSKYELDSYDIKKTISQKYENDRKKELQELENELREINAMLSLSTEQVYQTEILERYGVLKKGKLTI